MTVKIGAETELPTAIANKSAKPLPMPTRIDAHQTLSGWCFFQVDDAILDGGRVERSLIALVDSHGNDITVEPVLIREYGNETEAALGEKDVPNTA